MKNILGIMLLVFTLLVVACKSEQKEKGGQSHENEHQHNSNSEESKPTKPLSPHTSAMAMIGDAHIHVDYSSPSVRGRIIFGGLVGYNTVWQAGAHKATWIETNKDLEMNGQTLPAGKYGFFVIPGKEVWTVMFNTRWDQHGKDEYSETEDVLRFEVAPQQLAETQESLIYGVTAKGEKEGTLSLSWEKTKIEIPFRLK